MAAKNVAVFGIFRNREAVEEAVGALEKAGFRTTDISVLLPENEGTKDLAHEKHTKAPGVHARNCIQTTDGTATAFAAKNVNGGGSSR